MKQLTLKILLLIIAALATGCGSNNQKITTIDKIYPIVDKIGAADGVGIRDIRVYVIDSCEYVGYINASNTDFLTHKGNCKFCINRNK